MRKVRATAAGLMILVTASWARGLPQIAILQPDGESLDEYATDVREDPWDMSQPTDVSSYANIADTTWGGGAFSGTSTASNPQFHLKVPLCCPIWAERHRMFAVKCSVSVPTACALFWREPETGWHNSGYISLAAGWNTVRRDLMKQAPGEWFGDVVALRFNPCNAQDVGFSVDWVTLRGAEHADDGFVIQWADSNPPNATLALYYDTDNMGFNGTLIASGLDATSSMDSLLWDVSGLSTGAYYVYGVLSDVNDTTRAYSEGPVWVNDPPSVTALSPGTSQRIPEGNDYATYVWMDPTDMEDDRDIDRIFQTEDLGLSGGIWRGICQQAAANLRIIACPIVPLDLFARGQRAIDANRYTRLSFRMYLSEEGPSQHMFRVFWYDSVQAPSGCTTSLDAFQGWHNYALDLTDVELGEWESPWDADSTNTGLRLDPTFAAGDTFALDWVRLTHADSVATESTLTAVKIKWEAYDPDDTAKVAIYYQSGDWAKPELVAGGLEEKDGADSLLWDTGFLPPDTYFVFVEVSDPYWTVADTACGRLFINEAPLFEFTAPSAEGQDDYATVERGDAWDMNEASDVEETQSLTWWTLSGGILTGETCEQDAWVKFPIGGKIPAERYHRLSYRFWDQGPQDIGVGSVIKAYFRRYGCTTSGGGPAVLEEDWKVYTYDLTTAPLGGEINDPVGWADSVVMFRIDPHEFPWPRMFKIDYVRISTDAWGDNSFTIRWWDDDDAGDNALISFYADTNDSGFDGAFIDSVRAGSGPDTLVWDTTSAPADTYYLYVEIDDGLNIVRRYAGYVGIPVLVKPGWSQEAPRGLSIVQSGPNAVRLGWSYGQDSPGAVAFRVYRSQTPVFSPSPVNMIGETPSLWFVDQAAEAVGEPGLNYFYRVTALPEQGTESPPSGIVGEFDFLLPVGSSSGLGPPPVRR